MSQSDINNLQLDLSIVDAMYTKWFTEDEDMAGVTDPKVAIKKNKEFREKTKAWIAREEERKAQKKRN
jgi:methyl coenzyme M reductase alpha subunit